MTYPKITLFIPLVFTFSASIAMDPPMAPPVKRTYPLDFKPMRFANDPDDDKIIEPNPISITGDASATFEGMSIEDLKKVFETAPSRAKLIVKLLKKNIR